MSETHECPACGGEYSGRKGLGTHYRMAHDDEEPLKELMIRDLRKLSDEIGGTPTVADVTESDIWSRSSYCTWFGSFNDAVRQAGLEPNHENELSEQRLLNNLKQVAEKVGHSPSPRDVRKHGVHSPTTYRSVFGSWSAAKRLVGLEPLNEYNIGREKLIEELQRLDGELGHSPRMKDMAKHGVYSIMPYKDEFGSWTCALDSAGLEPFRSADDEAWYGAVYREAREERMETDGYQCQDCGLLNEAHKERYGKSLDVHHIDGDHTNNKQSNLITLCKKCHLGKWQKMSPLRPQSAN